MGLKYDSIFYLLEKDRAKPGHPWQGDSVTGQ